MILISSKMKETGTGVHIPEIQYILDTKLDECGVRLYNIAWKTAWLSEGSLHRYKEQIDEFWNKQQKQKHQSSSKIPKCHKLETEEIIEDKYSRKEISSKKKETKIEEEKEEEEIEVEEISSSPENSNNKRKCNWNLEDIVLKLKRSKKSDSSPPSSPIKNELQKDEKQKDEKQKDEKEHDWRVSPVFPPELAANEESFLNEKSSFLTQLEQKDDMGYINSLSSISGFQHLNNSSGNESNSSGDDEEADTISNGNVAIHASIRGDAQLQRLLEEEAKQESEASDKIIETKCNKCNKKFYRRSQLIRHLSNHVVHECLQCNAVFYCVKKYKKHMSTHETYPCDFCSEQFFDASAWYQHRAKHTMVECPSCDMVFYNKTALVKHKFEHLEYICPLCHFSFENLHHWISHRNYHGRSNSLHLARGTSFLSPIIACKECNMSFTTQETFLKHKCTNRSKTGSSTSTKAPVSNKAKGIVISGIRSVASGPYKRIINKKEIKDLIGIDQTLTCSS